MIAARNEKTMTRLTKSAFLVIDLRMPVVAITAGSMSSFWPSVT